MMDRDETMVAEVISELRAEVGKLRDLFQRRLVEDKNKKALIEIIQEQSRTVTGVLCHRQIETLFK